MISFLSKFLFFFSSFSILPPPKKEQLEILAWADGRHQGAPKFLQNSLRQYDCHTCYFLKSIWFCFNLFSIFSVLPLFFILCLRGLKTVQTRRLAHISLYPKIPKDIRDKFSPTFVKKPLGYLKLRDLKYVSVVLRNSGLRPYFLLRAIWKIGVYSELMDTYLPERIWVTQEMVFESTLLTNYLNDFQIDHVNFMHGENFFSVQTAYPTFTEFYVWDEFYTRLFQSMRASAGKFVYFSALERRTSSFAQKNILKYYNQDSRTAVRFNLILDNLQSFAQQQKCGLVVRLHPLHEKDYEMKALKARGIEQESKLIDIVDSITEAKYVCSEFSTVLYQASLLNREIVIDNTFQDRIDLIKDLDAIFIKKLTHVYLVKRN